MQILKDISVQFLKGVGPARCKLFEILGVYNIEDLLYFFPRRYEDRTKILKINQLKVGDWQTVTGKVIQQGSRRSWFTKKHVSEILLDDGTGRISCVWFNQPYLEKYLKADVRVVCYGKVDMYKNRLQMVAPEYELLDNDEEESLSINRIVPIYSLTKGMSQRYLRKTIYACLDKFKDQLIDELPVSLRNKHHLANIKRSIGNIHFPESFKEQEEAIKRVSFEEFYFFQISIFLRRLTMLKMQGIAHKIDDGFALQFMDALPFKLTGAQKRVIREISLDMKKQNPMLRLLQGDVGSGKTVVALFGILAAFKNHHQAALMAPTEILAQQHYSKILELLKSTPFSNMRVMLLTSNMNDIAKAQAYLDIKEGNVDFVVGTHALINHDIVFKKLSFVAIDEQHKFGVRQRALLSQKGSNPDILIMTATPIPRTLCISLYGDLDISTLDEMPLGRGKVKTQLYPIDESKKVYDLVKLKLKEGNQAFFVYPIIEKSEKADLKAAEGMFKQFSKEEFKDFRLGLIHGQMKKDQTQLIMNKFKNKEIDLLVATTVVEVGVDIPNANVMVIEHADRFGLAQLHQLRGRIGRGKEDGFCFLIADPQTQESQQRLEAILSTTDGFKIAEQDLLIRGPGLFFGRHQHGLNELKVANPLTQLDILELARKEALMLTVEDPELMSLEHKHIKSVIKGRYPKYLEMLAAG